MMGVIGAVRRELNREIRNAFNAGDFEAAFNLMQQLGAGLKSAMEAAVAGVRQWEAAQIAAINSEADQHIKEAAASPQYVPEATGCPEECHRRTAARHQDQKDAIQDQKWVIEDFQSAGSMMRCARWKTRSRPSRGSKSSCGARCGRSMRRFEGSAS